MKSFLVCLQKAFDIGLVCCLSIAGMSGVSKALLPIFKICVVIFALLIVTIIPLHTARANCTIPSQSIGVIDVDIINNSTPTVTVPGFNATCTLNEDMASARILICLRIDPTNDQYKTDNSFYVPRSDGSRVGFQVPGVNGSLTSVNKDTLPTNAIVWGFYTAKAGDKLNLPFGLGSIAIQPRALQDIVGDGLYTSTYNVYISQKENVPMGSTYGCPTIIPSSKNFAGTFTLSLNVKKQCVFENFLDVDFGTVGSVAALKNQTALGNIGIRCTSKTPYSIAIDSGLNESGGTRRMKSNNDFISYQLYQPDCSTPWNQTNAVGGVGGNVNQRNDHKVCAKLIAPTAVAPGAGTYVDTVIVTATF